MNILHQNKKWLLTSALQNISDQQIKTFSPDIWIMDWESTIPISAKLNARKITLPWLIGNSAYKKGVRINSIRTAEGLKDLLFLQENNVVPDIIVISKVQTATEFKIASALLQNFKDYVQLCATVEACQAIGSVETIQRAAVEYGVHIFEAAMQEKLAPLLADTL